MKKIEPGSELHFALLGVPMGWNFLTGKDYADMQAFAKAVWNAALATPSPQPAEEPTDAMVQAYLDAQRAAVEEADNYGRPNVGGLHTNTVREACRAGLRAAIAAQEKPNE